MPHELTGLLAGFEVNGSIDLWLDADDGSRVALDLPSDIAVTSHPIELTDAQGARVARAGDRVCVTGEVVTERLIAQRVSVVRTSRPGELLFTEEERARAQQRALTRLIVMLVATAAMAVFTAAWLGQDSSAAVVVPAAMFGMGAAWMGLFIGYNRVKQKPWVFDAVDRATRRELHRSLWMGVLPSEGTRPALAAVLERRRNLTVFTWLYSVYLVTQFSWQASEATKTSSRAVWLAIAVLMTAALLASLWQGFIARGLRRKLAAG